MLEPSCYGEADVTEIFSQVIQQHYLTTITTRREEIIIQKLLYYLKHVILSKKKLCHTETGKHNPHMGNKSRKQELSHKKAKISASTTTSKGTI